MHTADNRRARRLGLTLGAAAGVAISLAVASPAAAAPPAKVKNDTLIVKGTGHDDKIILSLVEGELQVKINGEIEGSFAPDTFTEIEVLLKNGDDKFRVNPPDLVLPAEQVTINGGRGDDKLNGGAGVEQFIGGAGNDFVDGNGGNDTADLGSGRDRFRWDPGDGSDTIDGGTGTDTLDFRGNNNPEQMTLRPSLTAGRAEFFRVQANILMDMIRVERLALVAGGGEDTITVNDMSGTDFREANVNLTQVTIPGFEPIGGPDGANDTVIVNGTANADDIEVTAEDGGVEVDGLQPETRITNSERTDLLQINGGGGDDELEVGAGVAPLITVMSTLNIAVP